ncbi:extracellular solute-binding protein [Acuticoccus kandeliae]|uniref:extracellular solute-binding protein n=1 Tax=Acuticoccus kandeliae TaxID=2073160 RepID=UPI000D3E2CAF|nr:extracellular solute-binding protein [Acuticoccus kandeliae]
MSQSPPTRSAKPSAAPTRRRVLKGAAATAAAGLAAPWVTTAARAAGELTVVLNQGLPAKLWIDEVNPIFEKETGAKLNVQQSVTSNMLAMLETQKDNPPDLLQFSEAGVFLARDQGLLRQHNVKNIPNFANLIPAFDMADGYSAGGFDAYHTLHYNTQRIKEAPTSWQALWDPAYSGRIAIPPITWNNGVRMVTTAAQIATGKPFAEAQYELAAGLEYLAKLKDNGVVVYTGAPQAIQMVQSGQIPLVPFYGPFINPVIDEGAPVAPATALEEGAHGEIVGLNMALNAPNVELAEVYVNISLSKEFEEKIDSVLKTRCGHKDVTPSAETAARIGDPDKTLYADWGFLSRERKALTDAWNEHFG